MTGARTAKAEGAEAAGAAEETAGATTGREAVRKSVKNIRVADLIPAGMFAELIWVLVKTSSISKGEIAPNALGGVDKDRPKVETTAANQSPGRPALSANSVKVAKLTTGAAPAVVVERAVEAIMATTPCTQKVR